MELARHIEPQQILSHTFQPTLGIGSKDLNTFDKDGSTLASEPSK